MNLTQLINQFELVTDTEEGLRQLRKTILNLAVRGKLTEQNPDDEPAEELLKRVKTEKQRLYEEGKIRKPKYFDKVAYKEISFSIPNDWQWCRLNELSIVETGKRMKGGARDEGIISLGGEHLNPDGTIDYTVPRYIN